MNAAAELIAAFQAQKNERVRCLLLMTFCDAKLQEALPLFVEQLRSEEECLQRWSEMGLRALNTPEARKALWEAGLTKRPNRP